MLDTHTHILPKMDDGSKSPEQSIKMLRKEVRQGITRVIFTPHYYANREEPAKFLKRRKESLALLAAESAGGNMPKCYAGAEVAYFRGMSRIEEIENLCIGHTNAMLIEMPFCKWDRGMLAELEYLRESRGIQPVIAHVERYLRFQSMGIVKDLCDMGFWIQVNASFFLRWQTSWLALRMLKKRNIHFIGSDCHDIKNRPPNMGDAISLIDKRLGRHALMHLRHMESRLLEGD